MKQKFTLLALAATLAAAGSSHAALTMLIRPSTFEFALVGSDTGTPGAAVPVITWSAVVAGSTVDASDQPYDNDLAFTTTVGTPGEDTFEFFDTRIFGTAPETIVFELGVSDGGVEQTITGTGVYQSYEGLTFANKAALESLVGGSLDLALGGATGFSAIDVVLVPEPGSALLFGLGAFGLFVRRRRV